jgi:hypothetical protein
MNRILKTGALFASTLFMTIVTTYAQDGWNWGEQVDVAKEKNAIYSDLVKAKNYKDAIPPHTWLLENAPDLNESLYQNGATMYEELADAATDAALKATYQAKCLEMYDLRIKYFGKEDYVLNRKVVVAYKFYRSEKTQYKSLYDMFTKAFALNGTEFYNGNILAYMDVVRRYKLSTKAISDEKVLDIYSALMDVIDAKRATESGDAMDKYADQLDKLLTSRQG